MNNWKKIRFSTSYKHKQWGKKTLGGCRVKSWPNVASRQLQSCKNVQQKYRDIACKLRPAGSDPEAVCQKNSFLKVSVSLGGCVPSVAHGKHCVRRRCVQATKTRQKLALSLTPLGAVRAAAEGTGYKIRRLEKSRGVRFDSRLVLSVRCDALWAWNDRSVFLLALLSVSGNTHAVSLLHAS